MKRNLRNILFVTVMCLVLAGCNKYTKFKDYFVAFNLTDSSPTVINASASTNAKYVVQLCSVKPVATIEVYFSVTPGDGLTEGVDYKIKTSGGKLVFLPGIYTRNIEIEWLSHELNPSKDNTLKISLTGVTNDDIGIGYPGPDAKYKEILIYKTQN